MIQSADGRSLGVFSDDGERLLVRDMGTDEVSWVTTSGVTVISPAATMTKWESYPDWQVYQDVHLRDRHSFPTIDGEDLRVGDRVESSGGAPLGGIIFGDGVGVVESSESVEGSIHLGLKPAGDAAQLDDHPPGRGSAGALRRLQLRSVGPT